MYSTHLGLLDCFFAHRYWLWPHHLPHCLSSPFNLGSCILNKQCQFHIHIAVSASIISCRICDVITYMLTSSGSGHEPPIVASSYRTVMSIPSLSTILRTQYSNNVWIIYLTLEFFRKHLPLLFINDQNLQPEYLSHRLRQSSLELYPFSTFRLLPQQAVLSSKQDGLLWILAVVVVLLVVVVGCVYLGSCIRKDF